MTKNNLSHSSTYVYHSSANRATGLRFLLRYALSHRHSRMWVGAISLLLTQREVTE
jgi:hypothetical protein